MYILSNALKNLLRNKGRNLLLAAIILSIVATTVVTLSITHTAEGIIDEYRERFGSQVIISVDNDALNALLQERTLAPGMPLGIPQVSPRQNLAFANSRYIKESFIILRHNADNTELIAVDADTTDAPPMIMGGQAGTGGINMDDIIEPNFRVVGGAWDNEFTTGQRQLSEGRMPHADYEALISLEVAELNNLSVGDEIRLYSNLFTGEDIATVELRIIHHNLTIVGIYIDMTENPFAGLITSPLVNRRNEILTTLNTVTGHIGEGDSGFQVEATHYLHNPSYLAAFEAEARSLGLDDMLLVSTNEAEYNAVVAPIEGLRRIAQTFMLVVLILGGIVLIILSSIAIRERKYEIGVLRAMGLKKHKVAAGLWVEMLALTVICLVVGLGVGSAVAQPVSDTLLAAQLENLPEQNANGTQFGGMPVLDFGGGGTTYSPLDTLDITLGMGTILEIIGISLLLTSLAALVAIIRITKYEPIKILMERD